MARTINRFGDAMLRKLLGSQPAGACVPADYCGCLRSGNGYCNSSGRWVWYKRKAYYNCNGVCVTYNTRPICGTETSGLLC